MDYKLEVAVVAVIFHNANGTEHPSTARLVTRR